MLERAITSRVQRTCHLNMRMHSFPQLSGHRDARVSVGHTIGGSRLPPGGGDCSLERGARGPIGGTESFGLGDGGFAEQGTHLGEEVRLRLDPVLGTERERALAERRLEREVDGRVARVVRDEHG